MKEIDDLISQLETAHTMIRDLVNQVAASDTLYPGWTLKEFLAHLTGWDEATIGSLRAHLNNSEPGTPAYRGIDYYNAQSVEERVALDYKQVYAEWEIARKTLKEVVAKVTEEKFNQNLLMPWGKTGTVKLLVEIMIDHAYEHAEDLHKLIGQVMVKPPNAPNIEEHDPAVLEDAKDAIIAFHDQASTPSTPALPTEGEAITAALGESLVAQPNVSVDTLPQTAKAPQQEQTQEQKIDPLGPKVDETRS